MRTHLFETKQIDTKKSEFSSKNKTVSPYKKKEAKSPLPKPIEENALCAVKDLLAQQKQELLTESHSFKIDALALKPSAQVMQVFDKLIQSLTYVDQNGIQETTFFLDDHLGSLFEGAKVTITEYSTAPKTFNIAFEVDPRALTLLESHAADLVHAVQKGRFGFTIHRIDTRLTTEKTHQKVERKEDHTT